MTIKHTPGPWVVSDDGYGHLSVRSANERDTSDATYLEIATEVGGLRAGPNCRDHSEESANARLIAAAPELLEALTAVVEAIDKGGLDDFMCCNGRECGCRAATNGDLIVHDLRALITKATGEGA